MQVQVGDLRQPLEKLRIRAASPALDPVRPQIDVGPRSTMPRAAASYINSALVRVVLPAGATTGSQPKAINSKRVTGLNLGGGPGPRLCPTAAPRAAGPAPASAQPVRG